MIDQKTLQDLLYVELAVFTVMAVAAFVIMGCYLFNIIRSNTLFAAVEGRFMFDTRKIIWRVTNTGKMNFTVVEVGISAGGINVGYKPLVSEDDINTLPALLLAGDLVSYRKDMERFMFKPSDIEKLKAGNPVLEFYAKSASGKIFKQKTDINFAQFITDYMKK